MHLETVVPWNNSGTDPISMLGSHCFKMLSFSWRDDINEELAVEE
jgi:hypothetical protein